MVDAWSCPRCGDLGGVRQQLWNDESICTECCRRVLGEELAGRLSAAPRIVINERRRLPRQGYGALLITVLLLGLVWFSVGGTIGAVLSLALGLPITIYLVYAAGWERVIFEGGGIRVETPLATREYPQVELLGWHVYSQASKRRYSSDSFLRFRTPAREKPITLRLWGDRQALRELRRTLLLIAPEIEEQGMMAQLLPGITKAESDDE